MPSTMVIGLCVPQICDQASVDEIASHVNQLLVDQVTPFFQNFKSLDSTFGYFSFSTSALLPDESLHEDQDKQLYPFAGLLILLVVLLVLQVTGFIEEISQRSKAPSIRPEHASVAREQLSELQFELYIDDPFGSTGPQRLQSLEVKESNLIKKIQTLQPKQSIAQSEASSIFEVGPRIYLINYMEQLREKRFSASIASFNSSIYQKKRAMRNFWGKVRKSFSPSRNWNLLYQRRALSEQNGQFGYPVDMKQFEVIDGVKVLATLWILIMCSLLFTTSTSFYNPWQYFTIQNNVSFTVLVQGMLCFDLLISISALFSFYKLARFQQTSNSIHCCKSFFLRLCRLLPLYYFTFLFGWAGLPSLIHKGPMWDRYSKLYKDCSTYWWTEIFLIGNIIPWERPQLQGCFFWNWYICLDVQLFLLIPPIVKLWGKYRKETEMALVVALLMLSILDFILLYNFTDYSVGVLSSRNTNMESLIAERPWGRLDCFILGILFAIILLHIREYRENKINTQILKWSQ